MNHESAPVAQTSVTAEASESDAPMGTKARRPSRAMFHVSGVVLVALAIAGVFALSTTRKRAEAQEATSRKDELALGARVDVVKVAKTDAPRTITLTGEVHALRQATLYAKTAGYLKYVKVEKGERVKANDVLGVIESPETEHELASKQADLAIKKLTDDRFQHLGKNGLVSQQEMERSAAEVTIAKAELDRISSLHGYQVIRAPFDGIITARYADPGALMPAATGSTTAAQALVDIADLDRVRVYLYLGQQEALFVHEGDAVSLWTDQMPEKKVLAKVTRFTHELDPRTRTMLTEIEMSNKEAQFYPGTTVRASLSLHVPSALTVPADAISYRAGKPVAVVIKDGHAKIVPVEISDPDGVSVRVVRGLAEGDAVALHTGDDVADGAAVRVVAR